MRDDPTIWSWIKEAEPEITEPDVVAVLIMASAASAGGSPTFLMGTTTAHPANQHAHTARPSF